MNFSNKLGLSLFVFLAFCPQKVCFAPARTRKPSPILANKSKFHPRGYDKLDDFLEPEKRGTKEPVNQYPWIGHLLALGLDPEAIVRRSAIYDQISASEASSRTELEAEEFENQKSIEKELILLKIPQIEAGRRKAILTFEQRESAAIKETMQEAKNQIYANLKEELNFLNLLLSDSGKALAENFFLDTITLQKEKEIKDFYKNHKDFCDKNPDLYEKHKQNLIRNHFSLMKPQLMTNLRLKRDELNQKLFELSCQEFGLTNLT